jgi:tetratricopeptide (TPR) repeat protein
MTWRNLAASLSLASFCILLFGQNDDELAIKKFESLIEAGSYTDAAAPLAKYTADHPQSWRALYQLGYIDFRLHRFGESLALLSRSLVINQNFAESHKILAFDLNILGRGDLAIQELQRAIVLEPRSFESHYELGRIYCDRGSYVKAVEELEQAKTLNAGVVKVYHNLGLAYAGVGDNRKAVENFEEGLTLNTKQSTRSAWPLIDYGTYFNLQGEFAKARDMLQQSIAISDRWDQAFSELCKAYRGLGQTEPAIKSLQRAIAINPSKAEYHYALARLYSQTNEKAKASQELTLYEIARKK